MKKIQTHHSANALIEKTLCVLFEKVAISYISVVVNVHVGRAGELIWLVLESRVLVRQLSPFLSQGLTHRLVLYQRDPEETAAKTQTFSL